MLRSLLLVFCIFAGAAVAAEGWLQNYRKTDPPTPAPDAAFTDSDGGEITLAQFRGKLVVLNFWATWCAPCRREMPSLDRLQGKLGGETLEVVALSIDRSGVERVDPFFEQHSIQQLKRYLDPHNAVGRAMNVHRLPTTILIDTKGHEIGRLEGPAEWDATEILTFLQDQLPGIDSGALAPPK
ncbi:MAG: TlpA disulfide reductase family protein [Alphaproteobacteria bacterium]|nr:TlpA disulfide reductase family protein [Alphaproteobacteria bacterium]MCY4319868.1 TlpA disulfide reductase family protein [Alphaproteobacteria bacterium]